MSKEDDLLVKRIMDQILAVNSDEELRIKAAIDSFATSSGYAFEYCKSVDSDGYQCFKYLLKDVCRKFDLEVMAFYDKDLSMKASFKKPSKFSLLELNENGFTYSVKDNVLSVYTKLLKVNNPVDKIEEFINKVNSDKSVETFLG
ncbi:MAG: hypothetical protein MJZ37_02990 [Bacilli bacterium]|nr:hypothetical protein [Bacilli bacterium]